MDINNSSVAGAVINLARERNRRLNEHAAPVMEMLFEQIAGTHSMVVLTDATGTVLRTALTTVGVSAPERM